MPQTSRPKGKLRPEHLKLGQALFERPYVGSQDKLTQLRLQVNEYETGNKCGKLGEEMALFLVDFGNTWQVVVDHFEGGRDGGPEARARLISIAKGDPIKAGHTFPLSLSKSETHKLLHSEKELCNLIDKVAEIVLNELSQKKPHKEVLVKLCNEMLTFLSAIAQADPPSFPIWISIMNTSADEASEAFQKWHKRSC